MPKTLWTVFAAAVLLAAPVEADVKKPAKNPALDEALAANARTILCRLDSAMKHPKKALHVGVLKFLVQTGNAPPADNAGPLNLHVAGRLEAALILALDKSNKDRVRILHNSSADVSPRANHLTEAGRKAFFDQPYRPAWGKEDRLDAHAFLTGLVKIEEGARTAQIIVQAFDRTGEKLVEVCTFKAATNPVLLTEAGISFALPRGGNPEDIEKLAAAWTDEEMPPQTITSVQGKADKCRTARDFLRDAPINLEVRYNGQPVQVREDGTVPEPAPNDKVTFELRHKCADDRNTYGVVLKVNGQNTILPDDPEPNDSRCVKWILKPGARFEIKGFQLDFQEEAREFASLSKVESRREEVNYSRHAGTFTVVVFQGRRDGEAARIVRSERGDVPAIARGVPDGMAKNTTLTALQGQLRGAASTAAEPAKGRSRGLVVAGARTKQPVEQIEFNAIPVPVSVIQIRYYKPQTNDRP